MNDMVAVTVPKSDQWNYDDFLAGPITFTIAGVKVKPGTEQPVDISLEGTKKFYRPCKSMCRALVAAWGPNSAEYAGRSFTLYGDPSIKWGGMEVGGIRISHLSHIDAPITMALTATKGSRKPYTVRPLEAQVDYSLALNACTTLEELASCWKRIPKADQARYLAVKDERKAILSAPADSKTTEGNAQ